MSPHVTSHLGSYVQVSLLRLASLPLTKSKGAIYFSKKGKEDLFKASAEELEGPICMMSHSLALCRRVSLLYGKAQRRGEQRHNTDLHTHCIISSQLQLRSGGGQASQADLHSCFITSRHLCFIPPSCEREPGLQLLTLKFIPLLLT